MGDNNNPYFGTSLANVQARPFEHEALLDRQGQIARIIQAKKCPCISRGRPDLHCEICKGFGYTLKFQRRALVVDENSTHYGNFEIFPFWTPITKVYKVERFLNEVQGGIKEYTVESFTDESIEISDPLGGCPPKRHEKLRVTYEYDLWDFCDGEDSEIISDYEIKTIGTLVPVVRNSSNPFRINADLAKVVEVRNITQGIVYTVKDFFKQTIIIDDQAGSVPPMVSTDTLSVTYYKVKPAIVGTGRLTLTNAVIKAAEDLKEGDVQGIFSRVYNINKGDFVTFLVPRIRDEIVIAKGQSDIDEIPQFEVIDLDQTIIDEDGVEYEIETDYRLERYNDLVWVGNKPAAGKKYSFGFLYRPTYRIYKQNVDAMNNENKYFPNFCDMRFVNRYNKRDMSSDKIWQ